MNEGDLERPIFTVLIVDERAEDTSVPILADRPGLLVVTKGGGYRPGSPKAGWDHATPFLRQGLGSMWGLDLTVADAELTMAHVNPAMRDLVPVAERERAEAERTAVDWAVSTAAAELTPGGSRSRARR